MEKIMDQNSIDRMLKLSGIFLIKESKDVDAAIVKFFKRNPNAEAQLLKDLADSLDISQEQLQTRINTILTSLLKRIGRHGDVPDNKFDSEQLKMGLEIEKEHTDDPFVAEMIVKDHLSELRNYYTLLKQMETNAKEEEE